MPYWVEPENCDFIILAKFDKGKLFDARKISDDMVGEELNWGPVIARYSGVSAGWGDHDEEYPPDVWDVPSWVAWKPDAFEEVRLLKFEDQLNSENLKNT